MKIRRKSVISGIERTMDIPVNPEDWVQYQMGFVSINDAMPYLTDSDREFIMSGITSDEWEGLFAEIDKE